MQNLAAPRVEFRWGWVIPALLVFALLLNYGIAQASPAQVAQFAPVVVRASFLADYSRDADGLRFAPANANLVTDILRDQGREPGQDDLAAFGGLALTATPAASPSPTLAATPTPLLGLPTLVVGATLPPLVTQVVGGVGDTVGSVGDTVGSVVDGVGDAVDDVTDTAEDLVEDVVDTAGDIVEDTTNGLICGLLGCR